MKKLQGDRKKGVVLIIVLVVVVLLSLAAYSFSDLMLVHRRAVQQSGRQVQSRALVQSGIEMTCVFLLNDEATRLEAGGVWNNPLQFQGRIVVDDEDPRWRGNVTVLAPSLDNDGVPGGVRYGLENESTRLNINSLLLADDYQEEGGRTLLMSLPGMTMEIADAILDYIDEDDETRELGAEVDYYSSLSPPYAPKNGPLETVEELLLVRGVTPEMLFGGDVNRNGMIDAGELPPAFESADMAPGALDRGWSAYLTLYSMEKNMRADGQPRVYLNQEDLAQLDAELRAVLPPEWATYIVAYRQNGPYSGNRESGPAIDGQLDLTKKGGTTFVQALDLIGTKVRVRFEGEEDTTVMESPFPEDIGAMRFYLPLLLDNVTVNESPIIPGRVNINQAPRSILLGIPSITPEIVDQIISLRDEDTEEDRPNRRHETWLMVEAVVTLNEMRSLSPFVTAGGDVFRAQVVGYYEEGGAASRAEVVFDATSVPRVLFWRDLTHLGRGYALETLGVTFEEEPQ